jgi:hypothetical protein
VLGETAKMKIHWLIIASVSISLVLSLAATLASYNVYYSDPRIVDASFVYRGWPFSWIFESWSYWSHPPRYACLFQPLNFVIDFIFYAAIFQIPMLLCLTFRQASTLKRKIAKNEIRRTVVIALTR